MAYATMNFEFESISPVSSQQEVEFGCLFVTWNMRLRGMKDPTVASAAESPAMHAPEIKLPPPPVQPQAQ